MHIALYCLLPAMTFCLAPQCIVWQLQGFKIIQQTAQAEHSSRMQQGTPTPQNLTESKREGFNRLAKLKQTRDRSFLHEKLAGDQT